MSLMVRVGTSNIGLRTGDYVIGRAPDCAIVVDDRLVSRQHARIRCQPAAWLVEDLGSSNGTFVNGERLTHPRRLAPGDVVLVGRTELQILPGDAIDLPPRQRVKTRDDRPSGPKQAQEAGAAAATTQKDVLDLLAGVAQRAIDHGSVEQGEKVLAPILGQLLNGLRNGTPPALDATLAACRHALTLAEATGKPVWLHYVVESFWHLAKPIPLPIVTRLGPVWRDTDGTDEGLLRSYVRRIKGMRDAGVADLDEVVAQLEALYRA
jgi:pSer/pThr/pTyr-binding forkhead associated (FHA) protein